MNKITCPNCGEINKFHFQKEYTYYDQYTVYEGKMARGVTRKSNGPNGKFKLLCGECLAIDEEDDIETAFEWEPSEKEIEILRDILARTQFADVSKILAEK